jgi:competence protein ComEA
MVLRVVMLSSLVVTVAAIVQPPSESSPPFPPGQGRDTLVKVCSGCHGAESAVAEFKRHEEWVKTLDEMAANGAQASDEEWTQIQTYLDKNYTYIFVNTATAKDLQTALDVTPAIADAIVRRRTEKGDFKAVEDLEAVPGLAAATVEARKDRFIF